jgi:outer membrane protein OmpA-like peptidoglycan-associated protein
VIASTWGAAVRDRPAARARGGWWVALIAVALVVAGIALSRSEAPTEPDPGGEDVPVLAGPVRGPYVTTAAALAAIPITFGADSAQVLDPSAVLRAAEVLRSDPAANALLVGYAADTPGPPEVAQRLSERRATAVADALQTAGVDRARLTTEGRGESDPLPTTAASRRVEIRVR